MDQQKQEAPEGSVLDTIEPTGDDSLEAVEDEPEPDFQKARHDIGAKDIDVTDFDHGLNKARGETGTIKQKLEEDVVLDYLANQIYGGPDSTVREYIANAETATVNAAEEELKKNGFDEDDLWVPTTPDLDADDVGEGDVEARRLAPDEILDAAREHVGYEPTIEIEWHKSNNLLAIQDNGIGFTPREVIDVLAYTGRSGERDRGDVSGAFGMGVLSAHNAVGKEGTYTLITRTRRADVPDWAQESFAAYCYLGGYDGIEGGLPDGQYGTRFELPLKENLVDNHSGYGNSEPAIRRWVSDSSEYCKVPVLYTEYEDGETVFDEEYGYKELAEDYEGPMVEIDTPKIRAVSYPSGSGDTLLVSMPIGRNERRTPSGAPWRVDVRIKNENGSIVECGCHQSQIENGKTVMGRRIPAGPNEGEIAVFDSSPSAETGGDVVVSSEADLSDWERVESHTTHCGLMVADDMEYESMSDERQENFVPTSEVTGQDIKLPEPTANREELQKNSKFWEWIGNELGDKHTDMVGRLIRKVKGGVDDLIELSVEKPQEFSLLMSEMESYKGYQVNTADDFAQSVYNGTGVRLREEVAEKFMLMMRDVSLAPRERSGVSRKSRRRSEKIWRVYRESQPDGQVYMGCSINEDRCAVVWNSNDNNQVVRVESTGHYETFGEAFGWEKLKTVPTTADGAEDTDFEIPVSMQSSSGSSGSSNTVSRGGSRKNNSGKEAPNRELTVRKGTKKKHMSNVSCEDIKEGLEDAHDDSTDVDGISAGISTVDSLILFPSSTDKTISDHYKVSEDVPGRAVATCTVTAYEYLKDTPGIMHIDDLLTEAEQYTITTSEGDMKIGDADDNLLVHLVKDEYLEEFRDENVMEFLAEWLHDYLSDKKRDVNYAFRRNNENWPDEFIYAPVSKDTWTTIQPMGINQRVFTVAGSLRPRGSDYSYSFDNDAYLYAVGRLYNWDEETPEKQALQRIVDRADPKDAINLVESMTYLHDNGVKPASEQSGDVTINAVQQSTLDELEDDDDSSEAEDECIDHEAIADGGQ